MRCEVKIHQGATAINVDTKKVIILEAELIRQGEMLEAGGMVIDTPRNMYHLPNASEYTILRKYK